MSWYRSPLTVAALAALFAIGVSKDAAAVTFGDADGDEHPEVGGLMVEFPDGWGWPNCSGVLVHVDEDEGFGLFLTAGHCTESLEDYVDAGVLSDFGVNFDEEPDFFDPIQYSATAVYTNHDVATPFTDSVDWGLIRFEFDDASDLPEPATLAGAEYLDDFTQLELKSGTWIMVGYGATVDRMGGSYYYTDVRQNAEPGYSNLVGNTVKTNQVGPAGHGGGCYADSGGPLYWVDGDGEEILVAVTMGGHKKCYSHGLYNRIDNDDALDFVEEGKE